MPASVPSGLADALRQVKGPGTGLVVTAILNWVAIPLILLITVFVASRKGLATVPMLLVPLSALVLSGIMLVAGLKMKRLQAYWLAVAGSILAILVTPGNLIGLPIGIWALVVLSQRHVREAFRQEQGGAALQAAPAGRGWEGWKVAAVVVAAVMLVLAIPVGGILVAIAVPNFIKARDRARAVREQIPSFVIEGTVTDAATGQPIAGARVDDNAYGARPNRSPQQAWTDAQGHYKLRTWNEEHTLAASASGYETKLVVFKSNRSRAGQPVRLDFRLQPLPADQFAVSGVETQAVEEAVQRGSEAYQRGDYSRAFGLLLPAALNGDPVAQHRVGVMYFMGQGVAQNTAEATRWFRKAAEQGQGESQYSMGMRYLLGESVMRDPSEAARWFKLAAEQGVGFAQAALALRYANGEGVPQDYVEAYKWATLARSQVGPSNAGVSLSNLEEKLTREQIVEAKRQAKEFVPKRVGPADP